MSSGDSYTFIAAGKMLATFTNILIKNGFEPVRANECAELFTSSSVDGVYTHGVNRFGKFVEYVKKGFVRPAAVPTLRHKSGSIEQWNGNLGPGPLNAVFATDRAIELAGEAGIGCVALSNTNHWMRGGSYGWRAARKGFAFIGFTNTIANMPAWGAIDKRLGNNPLVMAVPYNDEAVVLDMAMSQYSFGALELAKMKGEKLDSAGGYDSNGNLSQDPEAIIGSGRLLPAGLWKGAGLSLLLDILASVLSGGLATHQISSKETEYASQVFLAIDISKLSDRTMINHVVESILSNYLQSAPSDPQKKVVYPGQRLLETRKRNLEKGIPVLTKVWNEILDL